MTDVNVLRDEVSDSANKLRSAGDTVQEAMGEAGACAFGPGAAGRGYGSEGSAVHTATGKVVPTLSAWHTATADVADAVIGAVYLYSGQETTNTCAVTKLVS